MFYLNVQVKICKFRDLFIRFALGMEDLLSVSLMYLQICTGYKFGSFLRFYMKLCYTTFKFQKTKVINRA